LYQKGGGDSRSKARRGKEFLGHAQRGLHLPISLTRLLKKEFFKREKPVQAVEPPGGGLCLRKTGLPLAPGGKKKNFSAIGTKKPSFKEKEDSPNKVPFYEKRSIFGRKKRPVLPVIEEKKKKQMRPYEKREKRALLSQRGSIRISLGEGPLSSKGKQEKEKGKGHQVMKGISILS